MRLSLHNISSPGVTILSNLFIDHYMPRANGEFVKIYLYLIRCLGSGQNDLNLASLADIFSCTESDILRALRYWETEKLLVLSGKEEQTSIDFLEPTAPSGGNQSSALTANSGTITSESRSASGNRRTALPESRSVSEPTAPFSAAGLAQPPRTRLTADRVKELKSQDDVRQIIFIAEQYRGLPLKTSDIDSLLYIYDTLHFSVDLIDYLIEYCVSRGKKRMSYIESVAQSWHKTGIDTVPKAKQETSAYNQDYYSVLKAFGITNRNPIPSEVNMINRWMNEYGFTLDIITEACARTVESTGGASFTYANKILKRWKDRDVHHLSDIEALDTLHKQLAAERAEQKAQRKTSSAPNSFNNFQQRDYDYAQLENQLLK